MFYLLLIALAITGEVLPEEHNRFYALGTGQPPIVLLREGDELWNARMMDRKNLQHIPQGLFHLNGLAVGRKAKEDFNYYDMSELLSIETITQLVTNKRFDVQGGRVYINHDYELDEREGIEVRYSSNDIREEGFSVVILWDKQFDDEMVLPASKHTKLNHTNISGFSLEKLRVARNEIFARHGYIFSSKELTYYFSATSWYKPETKNVSLTEIEKYNVMFLKQLEQEQETQSQSPKANQQHSVYTDDELMPGSDKRPLKKSELTGFSAQELRFIRNEIFARHGYIFKSDDLTEHFSKRTWYYPIFDSVELSAIEAANVRLIKSLEGGQ